MKRVLEKRVVREPRSIQMDSPCPCTCSGCSGTPSWNYLNNLDRKDANTTV